jgi:ubiquinone/menaquinone biosynthesis C-methylase UbiE
VIDLAAGTGNLTRALLPSGANVVAVEPLAEMRAAITEVKTLAGTAEAIPVAAASVDAVTVAQAFHWFDHEKALPEIHRVLRPGGGLGLVWNHGDSTTAWVAELDAVVREARPAGVPSFRDSDWRAPLETTTLFERPEEREFAHEVSANAETIRARFASVSFVAALPEADRASLFARIDEITARLPERFPYPYRTHIFACRRRD